MAQALVHPSYAYEKGLGGDNQRLEFLGDAVLGLALAASLYGRLANLDEGHLTRLRSRLVRREALARLGRAFGVADRVRLGAGERSVSPVPSERVVADATEAVAGALYLLWGYERTERFFVGLMEEAISGELSRGTWSDAKSRLQERLQRTGMNPVYEVIADVGPPHARRFSVQVRRGTDGPVLGRGEGVSKKAAETEAARRALEALGSAGDDA